VPVTVRGQQKAMSAAKANEVRYDQRARRRGRRNSSAGGCPGASLEALQALCRRRRFAPILRACQRPVFPAFKAELGVCRVLALALVSIARGRGVQLGCLQSTCARHLIACRWRTEVEVGAQLIFPSLWRINPACDRRMPSRVGPFMSARRPKEGRWTGMRDPTHSAFSSPFLALFWPFFLALFSGRAVHCADRAHFERLRHRRRFRARFLILRHSADLRCCDAMGGLTQSPTSYCRSPCRFCRV